MASHVHQDDPGEFTPNQRDRFDRLLNAFIDPEDRDPDDLTSQDYIGLHSRLERVLGVQPGIGKDGNSRTMTPEQRAEWSQRLLVATQAAHRLTQQNHDAADMARKIDDLEQDFNRLKSFDGDPRMKAGFEHFARRAPEDQRRITLNRFYKFLEEQPDLLVDALEHFQPSAALARTKIDDLTSFSTECDEQNKQLKRDLNVWTVRTNELRDFQSIQKTDVRKLTEQYITLRSQWDNVEGSLQNDVRIAQPAQVKTETSHADWRSRFEQEQQLSKNQGDEIQRINTELERHRTSSRGQQGIVEDLRRRLKDTDTTVRERSAELEQHRTSSRDQQGIVKDLRRRLKDTETTVRERSAELEQHRTSSRDQQDIVEDLRRRLKDTETTVRERAAELKDTQNNAFMKDCDLVLMRKEKNDLRIEVDIHKGIVEEEIRQSCRLQRQLGLLKQDKEQVASELEESSRSSKDLEAQLARKMASEKTHLEQIAQSTAEMEKLKASCNAQQKQHKEQMAHIEDLRLQRDDRDQHLNQALSKVTDSRQANLELSAQKDELQSQLANATIWIKQLEVYGDIWKLMVDQSGNHTADDIRVMGASLSAASSITRSIPGHEIRHEPIPYTSIAGLTGSGTEPLPRAAAISLFGRLHSRPCSIPIANIDAIGNHLRTGGHRSRRLMLILLHATLWKRCSLAHERPLTCSFAGSIVILRCFQLLYAYLTTEVVLTPIGEMLAAINPKLATGSALVQAMVDEIDSRSLPQRLTLAQCLGSLRTFVAVPESDYKLAMDYNNVIILRSNGEVACVHPAHYSFQAHFGKGWQIIFNEAPMVGTWTSPWWKYADYIDSVPRVFQWALSLQELPEKHARAVASRTNWLVDIVSL